MSKTAVNFGGQQKNGHEMNCIEFGFRTIAALNDSKDSSMERRMKKEMIMMQSGLI
jgi:hypothetical protein